MPSQYGISDTFYSGYDNEYYFDGFPYRGILNITRPLYHGGALFRAKIGKEYDVVSSSAQHLASNSVKIADLIEASSQKTIQFSEMAKLLTHNVESAVSEFISAESIKLTTAEQGASEIEKLTTANTRSKGSSVTAAEQELFAIENSKIFGVVETGTVSETTVSANTRKYDAQRSSEMAERLSGAGAKAVASERSGVVSETQNVSGLKVLSFVSFGIVGEVFKATSTSLRALFVGSVAFASQYTDGAKSYSAIKESETTQSQITTASRAQESTRSNVSVETQLSTAFKSKGLEKTSEVFSKTLFGANRSLGHSVTSETTEIMSSALARVITYGRVSSVTEKESTVSTTSHGVSVSGSPTLFQKEVAFKNFGYLVFSSVRESMFAVSGFLKDIVSDAFIIHGVEGDTITETDDNVNTFQDDGFGTVQDGDGIIFQDDGLSSYGEGT